MLTSTWVHDGGEAEEVGAYTGGKFGVDGWVSSSGVMPLSCGFLFRVVSVPAISIGLISWGWVKISLGVETLRALC